MTSSTLPSPAEVRRIHDRSLTDPAWFARNVLGVDPYDKQIEIIEAVRHAELTAIGELEGPAQVSVNGANGVGKDWTIGRIVIPWWMATHSAPCPKCDPNGEVSARLRAEGKKWSPQVEVVVMAPTHRQIAEIIWRELRYGYNSSRVPLGGRMLPSDAKWDISNGELGFAQGFSTDRAWNITGFHSPHLLVIISEAHNFPEDAIVSVKRLHPEVLLLSGNPFSQAGEFFDSHHAKRHLYRTVTISAYDSPNVKAGDQHVPGVVSLPDIEKMKEDWGEESPFFRATVLAEFAETEDGLLPLSWLQAAQERPGIDAGGDLHAGLDVAGPGEDETVLTLRSGNAILHQKAWRMPDPRGEVVSELDPFKKRLLVINVDSAGIGYYLGLHLQDLGFNVRLVNVGEAAYDTEHYANLKAELYWGLRMRFKDGHVDGLTSEKAMSQLASIRYGHNARGQVQIEKKEDAKKRGIPSPDYGESIMLCFAYGDEVGSTAELLDAMKQQDAVPATPTQQREREDAGRGESLYGKAF